MLSSLFSISPTLKMDAACPHASVILNRIIRCHVSGSSTPIYTLLESILDSLLISDTV
jgi:hypothetical protein